MTREELDSFCSKEFESLRGLARNLSSIIKPDKTTYDIQETAAIGAFLFSAYTGIERVLEKVLVFDSLQVKEGEQKHSDILKKAFELGVIPPDLYSALSRYLAFRDFFSRSYIYELNSQKLATLAQNLEPIIGELEKEISGYIVSI